MHADHISPGRGGDSQLLALIMAGVDLNRSSPFITTSEAAVMSQESRINTAQQFSVCYLNPFHNIISYLWTTMNAVLNWTKLYCAMDLTTEYNKLSRPHQILKDILLLDADIPCFSYVMQIFTGDHHWRRRCIDA